MDEMIASLPTALRQGPYVAVAVLFAAAHLLSAACNALGIDFPAPIIGMAAIIAGLLIASRTYPAAEAKVVEFFAPGVDWVSHRWLAVFYSPALVTLPLAVRPLGASTLVKAAAVVGLGVPATMAFTGAAARAIRKLAGTPMEPIPYEGHAVKFGPALHAGWSIAAAASLGVAALAGAPADRVAGVVFLLSSTVLGYLWGSSLPAVLQRVIHPMVMCAGAANAATALLGVVTGR
jgi:putative effector of murein hydrolase LrgA (UPF0299 family)